MIEFVNANIAIRNSKSNLGFISWRADGLWGDDMFQLQPVAMQDGREIFDVMIFLK